MLKTVLKGLMHLVLGDYSVYRIFRSPETADAMDEAGCSTVIEMSREELLSIPPCTAREQYGYAGEGSHLFAYKEQGEVLAVCAFWHGQRYAQRGFWPLKDKEAKLVQVIVDPRARNRGLAERLIRCGSRKLMQEYGFARCYARIWHNNHPSIRAFEKAGWEETAIVYNVELFRLKKLRFERRQT